MYITLKQYVELYPWPSISGLRALYQKSKRQNLPTLKAFTKCGKTRLIDPVLFHEILRKQFHDLDPGTNKNS